jgi:hypothetical protein
MRGYRAQRGITIHAIAGFAEPVRNTALTAP